jgi:CheY-like chemotaxis protein
MVHRILVVDDEEAVRSMVRDVLESQGFRVVAAGEFNEATRKIKETRPHVALIDFLLPKKNGFALAEQIRKDSTTATMPIIMMSGVFKNPKTAVEAREKYQVVDFLSKPLDMDRLASILRRALRDIPDDGEDVPEAAPPPPSVPVVAKKSLAAPREASASGEMVLEMSSGPLIPPVAPAPSGSASVSPPPRGLSYGGKSRSSISAPSTTPVVTAGQSTLTPASSIDAGPRAGRPFPAMPGDGDLEHSPVALLISIARYDRLTGMLDLSAHGTHRRVYILRGQAIFMQSNSDGENVGALLLRRGRITEPDFDRCLDYMKTKKRTLQQALLDLRLANETDLATAYKLLAGQLLPSAIGMPGGTFKWRETDAFVGRVPEGNFEPLSVLFDGIKRHVHPPQILKFFKGREDIPMRRTAEFEALLPFFRRAFSANNVSAEVDGRATYREISRAHANEAAAVVPQLFALVTSGMVVLPEVGEENQMEVAVNAAAAEVAGISMAESFADEPPSRSSAPMPSDDGHFTAEEDKARQRVSKAHGLLMSKNFFEIFGIRPTNDLNFEHLKDAYFKLAKQWHGDAFAGLRLGGVQRLLDELFARITEAYETLNDPAGRQEYMLYLDRQSKGLPTDVQQIMRAEQVFDEALAAMRRRDQRGAHKLFQEATQLNSGQAIFWAYLGWSTYQLQPTMQSSLTEAVQLLKKATAMQENLPIAYQFLGQICVAREQVGEAKKWFDRCLEYEPGNIEAARGLRMLVSRAQDKGGGPKTSGLLSRFLSNKK